jgi:hypothetical protein
MSVDPVPYRPRTRMEVALLYGGWYGWAALPAWKKQPTVPWNWEAIPQTPTREELETLWTRVPKYPNDNANIAVLTGRRSGIVVGDVDPRHGGQLEMLWELGWPRNTATVLSGSGGWHVYCLCPDEGLRSVPTYAEGIEVKADGALVIAPNSRHPETHKPYRWVKGKEPWTVGIAPLPEHIAQDIRSVPIARCLETEACRDLDEQQLVYSPEETVNMVRRIMNRAIRSVQPGPNRVHRNVAAYRMGLQLGSLGLSRAEIVSLGELWERLVRNV